MGEKILLRPEEAANALGVSRTLIYRLMARGQIPCVHFGRSKRVPLEALRQWAKAQEGREPDTTTR